MKTFKELSAYCASLTDNLVRTPWDRRPKALAQVEQLAGAVGLDMNRYWSPAVDNYLGRITKAQIGEAVGEAVSAEAAARISGLKKPEMAREAEALLAGKGWLPVLLRKPEPERPEPVLDSKATKREAA